MFYEVSVGMYGAHTIVTSGVFLPKVPLVYHGLAWRLGRTTCTHLRYLQVRMNGIIAKKEIFPRIECYNKVVTTTTTTQTIH